MLKTIIIILLILGTVGYFTVTLSRTQTTDNQTLTEPQSLTETIASALPKFIPTIIPNPTPIPLNIPPSKTLNNDYHIFQTYNNCGPAALSMALSYYGINKSQAQLGEELRPYQIPGGDNDDKSVTLEEVAEKSKEYGLTPYLRPNGNNEIIKKFIASDIPVVARTWLKEGDDIGHYRIIKGYDDNTKEFIQDDSLQGKNLRYSYDSFDKIWDKFNYQYLVLIPESKLELAKQIIGEDLNEKVAWQKAVELSKQKLQENPNDYTAGFNLSVAYYKLGEYQKSVEAFEKVESKLPFRTLWYQIEPILSYYELGNYNRVIQISDQILGYHNRAFSELYILKGNIYLKQGNKEAAKTEFQKAVQYNQSLKSAKDALSSVN